MSEIAIPAAIVGNEFVLPQPHSEAAAAEAAPQPPAALPIAPALPLQPPREFLPPAEFTPAPLRPPQRLLNFLHRHSLGAFALLCLAVGIAAIEVGGSYWSARVLDAAKPAAAIKAVVPTITGLNLTVPANQLQSRLQTITGQPANLTVGSQTVPIGASTIRSWLQITPSQDKSQDYIRIKEGAIAASLSQLANQFVKAPVNQVSVNNQVVVAGSNGTSLTDPSGLAAQAKAVAKNVMNGKGLSFNTPLQSQAFQAVTPCAFSKLLVADVTTKQLAAFQGCSQVNQWLVSAGAPDTPTPIGEYHIYAKLTSQTMTGFNPNGTRYVQPNVPWVNYFTAGDAIHGNYWRPASVFGNVNTSHGCVGLPVNEAEWVYNWAPMGTTVITTNDPSLTFMNG